jgi:hypothetical protein
MKTNFTKGNPIDGQELLNKVEGLKMQLSRKFPLTIEISRQFDKNKEVIKIESVRDNETNEISKSNFILQVQTLDAENGFWLDSGEFVLNIRN